MCDVIDLVDELNANLNKVSSIVELIIDNRLLQEVPTPIVGGLSAVIGFVEQSRQLSNQLAETA